MRYLIAFNRLIIFTLSLFCFTLIAHAQSQRTFVSTTGNDSNAANLCSAQNPCRSFGVALGVTNTNGEIVVLTSGGYGAVTINKGVQITAPTGVYVAITVFAGEGITVNAAGATVVLRGLTINSQGASIGINATAVGALHVEGCIINGFFTNGINVSLNADGSQIFIKDTISRNNGVNGISIQTSVGTVRSSIDASRAENNGFYGFIASNRSRVTMRNCVASGNENGGFLAVSSASGASAEMSAEHCVASGNFNGFGVQGTSGGTATMRVARSTATNNAGNGFVQLAGGTFESLGNNFVQGNETNTSGTITIINGN